MPELKTRDVIASELLEIAKEVAEKRFKGGGTIEGLVHTLVPEVKHPDIDSHIIDVVERWAYTWLDVLQGGIKKEEVSRGDVFCELIKLPLENHNALQNL